MARIYASLFWIVGGIALYLMTSGMTSPDGGILALAYYLFVPFSVIASRSFQPGPLMVMMIVLALWAYYRWYQRQSWGNAILVGILSGSALFIKAVAVYPIFFTLAVYVLFGVGFRNAIRSSQVWVIGLLTILPVLVYHFYGIFILGSLESQFEGRFFPEMWLDPGFYIRWINEVRVSQGVEFMIQKLIGVILWTVLLLTPVCLATPRELSHNTLSLYPESQMVSPTKIGTADGWELQWSHDYGGMGHSQLAQPVGDLDDDGINEIIVGGYKSDGWCRILSYDITQQTYMEEYAWYVPGGSYRIPTGACIVELNEDGTLELVVSWGFTGADGVYAYTWDGTTLTTLDCYDGDGVDFLYDVYACDYNDDTHMEIIVSNAPNMGTSPWHVYALHWEVDHFVAEAFWSCPNGASCECPMVWGG